ncbi:MAG: hypothetical protein J6T94_05015 [Bacteroidaceae bacterium]|nr:hypothetical protein [Bacteroidaceae bacterium]
MQIVWRYIRTYKFSLLVVAIIIYLSFFTPPPTSLGEITNFDKFVHFSMYFCFCSVIWVEYLRSHSECRTGRMIVGGLLLPILFSGMLELGQAYLTTTRAGEWWDFASNSAGALLSALLCLLIVKTRSNPFHSPRKEG